MGTSAILIIGLAVAWLLQLGLSYWQMRRFYRRIADLRREGRVSIGLEGSAWRRRQYAVLVVDKETHRIITAEQLSGWTVLASLQPVPGLAGLHLDDLFRDDVETPVAKNKKLWLALRNAAQHIKDAEARAKAKAADEQSALASSTA